MDGREQLADYIRTGPASQAKLARDVGCSEGHLSLIVNKKRWASAKLAKELSRCTGIPMQQLVSPKAYEAHEYLRAG